MSQRTPTEQIATDGPRADWRGWSALVVLMLPVLLVSIDNTILNFALPAIARDLEPTSAQQLWIIDAYSLVLAGLLVTAGTLGDRFGRRRVLLIGAVGFTLVSVGAAFAPTSEWLIAARALMGVFGAALMPSTMSLLRSTFRNRDQRRIAIAAWAGMFAAGGALGPVVGGLLIEHYPWQSVFLLAVPMLVLMLILAPFFVKESRDPSPGPIDGWSIVLSMAALGPLAFGIKEFAVHGWIGLIPIAIGLAFGWWFVRRQLRTPHPMLDMSLFRRAKFSGSLVINLCCVMGYIGFLYFVSQHLQMIVGLSPMMAGIALIPGAVMSMSAGFIVTPFARRFSPARVVPIVLSIAVAGFVLVAVAGAHDVWMLVLAFVLMGAGAGAAQTVSGELIISSAPPAKAGAASAISETAYEFGAVLGTSILGGIITGWYRSALVLPPGLPDTAGIHARETLAGAMNEAENISGPLGDALRKAAADAFDGGVVLTSLIGAGLLVIASVVAATTLGRSRASSPR
ncbi:MFS transporter [Microbacterium amylolyticum]|uniref:DHA2 family multidrug resistance protein-like MFS transporter n=1 Tax=Microbacterium amylolyticum TaxID=936337 RepID=A0ABS4ZLJ1_9MICO|nr:MFS transporter [Microbacterium amylolyticum]MBP2437820.1 DHA2 family multidrug resistance protein-like MFS transporter [Microbacterium amylolyticum]